MKVYVLNVESNNYGERMAETDVFYKLKDAREEMNKKIKEELNNEYSFIKDVPRNEDGSLKDTREDIGEHEFEVFIDDDSVAIINDDYSIELWIVEKEIK